ncbi:MAG: NAD(P)-dependent alcohol dehydrogenase [Acidobacteria bacterium]|nr:NAD(P)-dependent alcohol dehydrogenase [Acidobacteriota bacterium]MBU1474737.1 NAD(P)-dependent alcohol dehydrogenase [Acidobacteriota bacterium]
MKAIVQNNYGGPDVLELKEIDMPTVKENDVLVRVHAAALNAGDVFSMRGSPWLARFSVGFPKPKNYVLGWDVAGQVEAVGKNVTLFLPGDEVFGGCSHAFAEYVIASEDKFAKKPANFTFEQAGALPSAAITALQALRDQGKVQPGQKVLINGASGGVGTFSVQIAKALGAEVTGVCSTAKVDMVRSLGADFVIDYTREDFTKGERRYDLILDNRGNRSFSDLKRVLKPDGLILPNTGHGGMSYVFKAYFMSMFSRRFGRPFLSVPNHKDLTVLKGLCESGKVTPVIDKTYPLSETPEALGYLDEGHARGKVVITVT